RLLSDLYKTLARLMSLVRASIYERRLWIKAMSAWTSAPAWRIDSTSFGSERAQRANFSASILSLFFRSFPFKVAGFATRHLWPRSSIRRLNQGEWVLASIAVKQGAMPVKRRR